MSISQKCIYAVRAVFELAQAPEGRAVKIGEIADRQGIPPKFLEAILSQLKAGGFMESRRGAEGGYLLARQPRLISLGEIIRFVDGPLHPAKGATGKGETDLDRVLAPIWQAAEEALAQVYDGITFQDLVERSRTRAALDFAI